MKKVYAEYLTFFIGFETKKYFLLLFGSKGGNNTAVRCPLHSKSLNCIPQLWKAKLGPEVNTLYG